LKYDLVIVGGGAAAFAAAIKASELGAETAMMNSGLPTGGTCVNVGCVPSKNLLNVGKDLFYPLRLHHDSLRFNRPAFDFPRAIEEKDAIVGSLRQDNYLNVLKSLDKVSLYDGRGRFVSSNAVSVNGELVEGEKFIIATGSRAAVPPFKGVDQVGYVTNVEALSLRELPESMIVVGAGPLGLEFAQMYQHFGTETTVLQRGPRILSREEPEMSRELQRRLEEEGMAIHTDVVIKEMHRENGLKAIRAKVRGEEKIFNGAQILLATGVIPNTEDLGLEAIGVQVDKSGFVMTNSEMRTSANHVWAAGDVKGAPFLETVAAKEGAVAAENALADQRKSIDYTSIPHAVFTSPELASVGLTEEELMRRKKVCSCRTVPLSMVPKARIVGDSSGAIKMVVDPESEVIVGVHIVAPLAADMIHEATLAVKFGLTVQDIIDMVHVFPTYSEGLKMAAQAFKRDISKMPCCAE